MANPAARDQILLVEDAGAIPHKADLPYPYPHRNPIDLNSCRATLRKWQRPHRNEVRNSIPSSKASSSPQFQIPNNIIFSNYLTPMITQKRHHSSNPNHSHTASSWCCPPRNIAKIAEASFQWHLQFNPRPVPSLWFDQRISCHYLAPTDKDIVLPALITS